MLLGTTNVLIYFIVVVLVAFFIRFMLNIDDEIFRKLLHFILLGSFLVFLYSYPTWQMMVAAALLFAVLVYPILALAEKIKVYSEFTTERKAGELKHSLLLVYSMFAVVVTVCCGLFQEKYLVLASLYAWGIGDVLAALVGKRFGKHKIRLPYLDGKKSYEGSLVMLITSIITVFIILSANSQMAYAHCLIISIIVGLISALAELYSQNGNDTVFCPLAAMVTLLPLMYFFGGI